MEIQYPEFGTRLRNEFVCMFRRSFCYCVVLALIMYDRLELAIAEPTEFNIRRSNKGAYVLGVIAEKWSTLWKRESKGDWFNLVLGERNRILTLDKKD